MNTDHATPELFAALAAAQAEIGNAAKNASNPHFRSTYADLAEVLTTIRPCLAKHGLCLIQAPSFTGSTVEVTSTIGHAAGGWIASTIACVPAKSDAQGIGSAITYLRRYAAAAMAGIAQEDDDGQAAAHNTPPASPPQRKPPTQRKATPPAGPTAAEMKAALREAYQKAGIASGDIAEAIMRKAGYLAEGQHVPDLDLDGLRRAYTARETMFADTSGEPVLILDADEPPA
jgi:hypothetical protein